MRRNYYLILVAFCFLIPNGMAQSRHSYRIGEVASDFKLKNVDGSIVSLSSFSEAKGFVVIFKGNECPFDKAYEQRIKSIFHKYSDKGCTFLSINSNNSSTPLKATGSNLLFPHLKDEGCVISKKFGVIRTPHVFLLNSDYKVLYSGAIDGSVFEQENIKVHYLENALDAFLNGKNIMEPITKAVGCAIPESN